MKRKLPAMTVTLSSTGNPDHGQCFGEDVLSPTQSVQVRDFVHASRVCREYITRYALGGGDWTGGSIRKGEELVARVSYNGMVWPV